MHANLQALRHPLPPRTQSRPRLTFALSDTAAPRRARARLHGLLADVLHALHNWPSSLTVCHGHLYKSTDIDVTFLICLCKYMQISQTNRKGIISLVGSFTFLLQCFLAPAQVLQLPTLC